MLCQMFIVGVTNESFSQYARSSSVKDLHVASPRPSLRVLRDYTRTVEVNCILLSTGQWNTQANNASRTGKHPKLYSKHCCIT